MVIQVASQRIAYMALPKAACSTVKRALAELDPDVDVDALHAPTVPNSKWHALYPTVRFRPHRWEKIPEDWFRFTVIRDPAKRLMACYTNRVVERRELHNSRKLKSGQVDLPMDPDPDFFFRNLGSYIDASSAIKHHALHTWLFTGTRLDRYGKVYTTENLSSLADDLSDWSGQPVTLHRENASASNLSVQDLSPVTHEALRPWMQMEYDFLHAFYPDPPVDLWRIESVGAHFPH